MEMTMREFKIGDFVYIPSSTLLFQFESDECQWVNHSKTFNDPLYVAYIGRNERDKKWCKIFVDGQVWLVDEGCVYMGDNKNV